MLFQSVARAVLGDQRGTLAEQVSARRVTERRLEKRGTRWNTPRLRLVRVEHVDPLFRERGFELRA